jgi:hypothetical protein
MLCIWRLPGAVRLGADGSSPQVASRGAAPCPSWLKQEWAVTMITGTEWLAHSGAVGRPVRAIGFGRPVLPPLLMSNDLGGGPDPEIRRSPRLALETRQIGQQAGRAGPAPWSSPGSSS